ncbi:MAG TPA: hypothetical protein PLE74_01280 [Candidatus Cloacimonadota bacterium]|nr:hypothetical protein [Candidatus Cloacimonadota bacterium]
MVGGLAVCQDDPHHFELLCEGRKIIDISTGDPLHGIDQVTRAENGTELHFDQQLIDMYGDCFGWFYLTVPSNIIQGKESIVLEVKGEEAGSQDWMMVFQYS